jgi:hypothetical protein
LPLNITRQKELDILVRRMGAIVSVFEVRSTTAGNPAFTAFRELMDVYVDACQKTYEASKDFIDEGADYSEEHKQRAAAAFQRIFGQAPGAFFAPPAPPVEKKK